MGVDEYRPVTTGTGRIVNGGSDLRGQVVALARGLASHGLLDARGRVSARVDGGVVTTPRTGGGAGREAPPPLGLLTVDDLVELDPGGGIRDGRWQPPVEIGLDLAIYRRRPAAGAIVQAQPRTVLAFVAADRELLPVTHTESALIHRSIPRLRPNGPLVEPARLAGVAEAIGEQPLAIIAGDGTVAIGRIPAEAAMLTQQLELLARSSVLALELSTSPSLVDPADSERIYAQKAPADDFMGYYADVSANRPAGTAVPDPTDESESGLRRRIVVACRLLHHHGLIEHLEHVSVRLDGSRFLITPRGHLGRLSPELVATVDMEGRWVAGPLEPPPFLHFHRDIFLARPEVRAIVHTHQPLARAMATAGQTLRPIHRSGAAQLVGPEPVYDVPDLMFDAPHRSAAVSVLGGASMLHERSHGVDFLASTVEEATVHALHYEDHAAVYLVARRVGIPRPLEQAMVEAARAVDPGPLEWWRHHLAELPLPNPPAR